MSMYERPITDTGEFLRGQRHCQQGLPHQENQHPDYDRGYNTQYQHEQNMSWASQQQEQRRGH